MRSSHLARRDRAAVTHGQVQPGESRSSAAAAAASSPAPISASVPSTASSRVGNLHVEGLIELLRRRSVDAALEWMG